MMSHSGTKKSPAELIFKFKPRCRLDLIMPTALIKKDIVNLKEPSTFFCAGESVKCRNYIGKDKWCFGNIKNREGKLHYIIEMDDGKLWRRHVDQISKVGEKIKTNNVKNDF